MHSPISLDTWNLETAFGRVTESTMSTYIEDLVFTMLKVGLLLTIGLSVRNINSDSLMGMA